MDKKIIAISGNIGSGKTSLTRRLSEKFGWIPFYESVEDNPYLKDFYDNMRRWAFNLQIYFLSKRFNDYQGIISGDNSVIIDRTIFEDGEIFAKILYDLGNIDERDYNNYQQLYKILITYLKPPDLMIYLKSDVDFLMERINSRGRGFENSISKDYMALLNNKYEEWISGYNLSEILILDAGKIDYVNNSEHFDMLVKMLNTKL